MKTVPFCSNRTGSLMRKEGTPLHKSAPLSPQASGGPALPVPADALVGGGVLLLTVAGVGWAVHRQCHDPGFTAFVCALMLLLSFLASALVAGEEESSASPERRAAPPEESGARLSPASRKRPLTIQDFQTYGPVHPGATCPHCGHKGFVQIRKLRREQGLSGVRISMALLTGGWSLLFLGLVRRSVLTRAHCCACHQTWTVPESRGLVASRTTSAHESRTGDCPGKFAA